ncbi:alkaline phosphatase family protein [Nocardioides litoris]|uniref:alkaline phosphatase family protein n=1 Tax=Nocardioides litoris TaxID=1926648 RepID=UPI001476A0CB|nr:alkaline phosphatase family protein [Nocardioides litoris]
MALPAALLPPRPWRRAGAVLLCVAALVAAATLPVAAADADRADLARRARADDPQVLAISLDGLNPSVLTRLGRAGLPHLWRMLDEGAWTLEARSQVELTLTLPNHTSMVTGRRVDRRRGGHGVTWNDDRRRPRTVQRAAGHPVSSVFSVVARRGGSTALYSTKTKFSLFPRSWPGAVDRTVIREEDDAAVVAAARADLVAADRDFTFLHLGAADQVGHASGWMSPAYDAAVRRLDHLVGQVLADARREPALADLTVLLTADHGGVPGTRDHADRRRRADYRVPFVAWGAGVAPADVYAINPGYVRPGRRQPDLAGRQPVRNGDVANASLRLLGLPPVPGSLYGKKRPLEVANAA